MICLQICLQNTNKMQWFVNKFKCNVKWKCTNGSSPQESVGLGCRICGGSIWSVLVVRIFKVQKIVFEPFSEYIKRLAIRVIQSANATNRLIYFGACMSK